MGVVESCIRLMRERAETAGIRLHQELPRSLPQMQADSRRLKQILYSAEEDRSVQDTSGFRCAGMVESIG